MSIRLPQADFILVRLIANPELRVEAGIQKEFDLLVTRISVFLLSNESRSTVPQVLLEELFYSRLLILRWMVSNPGFDLSESMKDVKEEISEMHIPSLEILKTNVLFAIDWISRATDSIISGQETSIGAANINEIADIPLFTYQQFIGSIEYSQPSAVIKNQLLGFTRASLIQELIVISFLLIDRKKLQISSSMANNLAGIIADATQDFAAYCLELEVVKMSTIDGYFNSHQGSKQDIAEQRRMAELGLSEFNQLF